MTFLNLSQVPAATAQMLVRRPVEEVFEAFVDPSVTTRFWFTKSSGRLTAGTRVLWEWEMYGAAAQVDVQAIEPNQRIQIRWGDETSGFTQVEWTFKSRGKRRPSSASSTRASRATATRSWPRRSIRRAASTWCSAR